MTSKILVVDDEDLVRESLQDILSENENYELFTAPSAEDAQPILERESIRVMVTDLKMEEMTGTELLEWSQDNSPLTEVIVITAHGSIESAVEAMRRGAFNYMTKPFSPETVEAEIERALEHRKLKAENEVLRAQVESRETGDFIGVSSPMNAVYDKIESVQDNDVSVLITGESGTGKELVARTIHEEGARADGPFVVVDCGTLPKNIIESELFGHKKGAFTGAKESKTGKFELADEGTLFLDEIANMHPELQAKLLRFLQEREFTPLGSNQARSVDTRVLAATNIDIDKAIESGTFREDLFYRLNVVRISLPPLRERIDDIPDLAYHFLKRYSSDINEDVTDFDDDTLQIFKSYSWPGNVRELENCVKSALTLANGNTISPSDIPNNIKPTTDTDSTNGDHESYKSLNQMEREHILRVLQNEDWNISSASDILDINRTTLYNKIEKYELREHEPS